MSKALTGPDGIERCGWSGAAPEFLDYHDHEWGYPVADDRRIFEKLCLESFQSGLSWRTILNKRENFRSAFHGFDFHKVAKFGDDDVARLLSDPGIVRHRGKIDAVVNNAKCAVKMQISEGSLGAFFWRYEDDAPSSEAQSRATSEVSVALSKELKRRGWKFVGPTTMFAFMQAMGLINDHAHGCAFRAHAAAARKSFDKPI
ncbi:MAG: DNA-3-methyladenine glycosylase I [Rhizobiaceae bacterium]|nr:DNA-3-methyladenine glycosylase I [Rhizobiaceae bacterium]